MHYYNFHIKDYMADTRHLSPLEDLAYRRLIDLYYLNDGFMTGVPKSLARMIAMPENETEIGVVLHEFFDQSSGDVWTHKRADHEMDRYKRKIKAASSGGKNSAKTRTSKWTSSKKQVDLNYPITNNHKPITNNQKKEEETKGTTNVVTAQSSGLVSLNKKQNDTAQFIGAYVKSYQGRYGPNTRPEIDGKAAGVAKAIVASIGADRASELVQVYLQLDDKWFKTKAYDLGTFKENLNKISLAHSTGLPPERIEANRADEEKWKRLREAAENDL